MRFLTALASFLNKVYLDSTTGVFSISYLVLSALVIVIHASPVMPVISPVLFVLPPSPTIQLSDDTPSLTNVYQPSESGLLNCLPGKPPL